MQEYHIEEVEGRGRCFRAAKTHRPGGKILSEEPYDAVLYDDSAASWCHHTFERPQRLHRWVADNCNIMSPHVGYLPLRGYPNLLCKPSQAERGSCCRCTGCRFARYSSREAQKAAWGCGHKEECAALKACAPRTPPATIRLAARVLWKHHRFHH